MSASQRKAADAVIEFGPLPGCRRVAALTSRREVRSLVIRVGRGFKEGRMTSGTSGWSAGKSPGNVARTAVDAGVGASEGKAGVRVVVETGASPACRRVALGAVFRKAGLTVVRVRGRCKFLDVTSKTI